MNASPPASMPWPLVVLIGLLAAGLGLTVDSLLAPPFLIAFLVYLLLPYRRHPWVIHLLGVLLVIAVLWLVSRFGGILLVLGFSLFLAYLLDPAVDFLERHRLSRTVAILVLLVPAVALVALGIILVAPPLVSQITDLLESIPEFAVGIQERVETLLESSQFQPFYERYQDQLPKAVEVAQRVVVGALERVLDTSRALGSVAAALILIPIITFYFLRDYDRLRAQSTELVPRKYHEWFSACTAEMDNLLGHWLRGAGVVALIIAIFTGIGLYFLDVPYALLLAALAGLFNFVPVIGFWISFLAAAVVALVGVGWIGLVKVAALYMGISVIEGQLLQPKIVGEAVGLHPVSMLLALIVFADIFGLIGAFLAVPLALLSLILIRQLRGLYLASDLYTDQLDEAPPPS